MDGGVSIYTLHPITWFKIFFVSSFLYPGLSLLSCFHDLILQEVTVLLNGLRIHHIQIQLYPGILFVVSMEHFFLSGDMCCVCVCVWNREAVLSLVYLTG